MNDFPHRLTVIGIVVASLFLGLFARLAYLQLYERANFVAAAKSNRTRDEIVPVTRGRILDRQGRVLVDNQLVSVISIDRKTLLKAQRVSVLSRLSTLLNRPYYQLERRFLDPQASTLHPIEVARAVTESAVLYIGEHADLFPGVSIELASERSYPYGQLAAHVLGYVRASNSAVTDPQCPDASYTDRDSVGLAGIEKSYECELRGIPGHDRLEVDKQNNIKKRTRLQDPVPGADVRLTIDIEVQRLVEESLLEGLKAARKEVFADDTSQYLRACCASAVVMDPQDGSVVAMASYPTFDPSDFIGSIPDAEYQEKYGDKNADVNHSPLVNRALSGRYAPGSTFKLVSSAAALRDDLITPSHTIDDTGSYRIKDCPNGVQCVYRNAGGVAHGKVDIVSALTVSSDVFFYTLGDQVFHNGGAKAKFAIQQTARSMGLDQETEIRLPNEPEPLIPDQESRIACHKANPKAFPEAGWRTGDTMNTALGQGEVLVTPLQLDNTYATFANGGNVLVPRIAYDVAAPTVPVPRDEKAVKTRRGAKGSNAGQRPGTASAAAAAATTSSTEATSTTTARLVGPLLSPGPGPGLVVETGAPTTTILSGAAPATTLLPPLPATPMVRKHVDLGERVRGPILAGLEGVVDSDRGTAYEAFRGFPLSTFSLAGKTGTAQQCRRQTTNCHRQDNAVFVAWGPVGAPRYVVSVVIEEGGFGGWTAAPVVRRIFDGLNGLPLHPVTVARGQVDR